MQTIANTAGSSKATVWSGRILSALVVLFMLLDATTKLMRDPHVLKAQFEIGWPAGQAQLLGVVVLICTILYAVPRTAVLGAILLTGWLGGATAAKVRLEDATALFSVAFGVIVWGGLYLRDPQLRTLILRGVG